MGDFELAQLNNWVTPGTHVFNTPLGPQMENDFQGWLQQNKVPFNSAAPVTDYDMRGFYLGLMRGDPVAQSAIDPNDSQLHYPDKWKTPLHETFSNESQWATPNAPHWTDDDKLITNEGRVVFDDRAPRPQPALRLQPVSGDPFGSNQ